jgi:hypothetical protein
MDAGTLSTHASWWLRREASRLGWRGIAGLALLAGSLGFAVAVLWPAEREAEALGNEVAALRKSLRSGGVGGPAAPVSKLAQLDTFYAFFPDVSTLPDWLGEVHLAAERHGLALDTGQYALQRTPGARLVRYELDLPLRGTYPRLRAFLAEVLTKIPAASIEEVLVRRDTVADREMEARVRIAIHLGGAQ